ncbi:MAG: T9SS type A sorting domain-containing protein [Candidatus Tenebribacter burtonii]|nr:T9SS type A sorting domain-containing protein [Candidatus Tenebribacter burtonii]
MKKNTILVIILISFTFLFGLSNEESFSSRMLDTSTTHDASNIWFRVSNYGFIGSGETDPKWPSLEFPAGSSIDYLYLGGLWFGAKKLRRDDNGEQIYWQNYPPLNDDDTTNNITQWRVVDTLTTVGCDGWHRINEFLPAYNPLEASYLGGQYFFYNIFDSVIKNVGDRLDFDDDGDGLIDEDPLGNPFDVNDPTGLYCFTNPVDEDVDGLIDEDCNYPGFESSIAYSYDFSPFENGNPDPDRDYGSSAGSNNHVSLDITLVQEIYSWPVQYYGNMILIKNIIYNHSTIDTLFDLSYAYYADADIGPQAFGGSAIAPDDISSYNGDEYNFAYAYDADADGGLSTGYLGLKILHPDNLDEQCWTWDVSWGPDDWQPLQYTSTTNETANEKYWLLTGRNPYDNYAVSIKDYPEYQINNFPNGTDTRFLYTIYGDMQGYSNPTPNSLNLAPGDSYEFYTLIFMGDSIQELENNLTLMENFIASGFDYSLFNGLPSIPYLSDVQDANFVADARVRWNVLSAPDEFRVYYKVAEAPAYTWEYIVVDHALSEYTITDLQPETEYKFKVACLYDEVYLESRTLTVLITEENQYIWSGDTDNNGYVDEDDIIPIGVYWREEGNARDQVSFSWVENNYPTNWDEQYAPFADCNGDGVVNITDILGICLNWNLTHSNAMNIPPIECDDLEQYRENFIEIYHELGTSEIEILLKNSIAQKFDLPIIEIVETNKLAQNFPNPFNPSTSISYSLIDEGKVELNIYNIRGQLVKKLLNENQLIGNHAAIWDGTDFNEQKVSSGLYFYRLRVNDKMIDTKKMIMLK